MKLHLITNDRDPRSEIRDPCDSHRSDLDQKKCAKNTNDPFIYGFLLLFDVCDPQMNSHREK